MSRYVEATVRSLEPSFDPFVTPERGLDSATPTWTTHLAVGDRFDAAP